MRLLAPKNLSCAWTPCALPGVGLQMVVVCKATLDLATGLPVAEAVPVTGDVGDGEPVYPSDFAPFKPRADVIVKATAHAPDARPVAYMQVAIKVGSLEKRLLVTGDRQWQRGLLGWSPGEPKQFESMPLRWARALGGPGDPVNPVGCGRDGKRMPNVELPDRLLKSPRDALAPAGFGATAAAWQPRCAMVGTYGSDYVKKYWPWFPPDFDYGYFNAAPADQQVAGWLRGDEELRFENLHRAHRTLSTRLPGLRSRLFVTMAGGEFREVPQRLDTLHCDLEQDRLTLVWRGHTPIDTPTMLGLEHVLATLEPMAEPKDAVHYRALRDESLRRLTAKAAVAKAPAAPGDETLAAATAALDKEMDQAVAAAAAALEAQQQILAEKGVFAASAPVPAAEANAPAPAWSRERVLAAHAGGAGCAGQVLAGLDLSACDLHGIDLAGADLTGCKLDGADLSGANLTAAILPGASCNGTKLDGAKLDRADLTGARAAGASWRGASLDRTLLTAVVGPEGDFSQSRGAATQFAGADLSKATFAGAALAKADFSGCKLVGADFTKADLAEARLHAADATGAVFRHASAKGLRADDGAIFRSADFRHADVAGGVLEFADLRSCDLRYASFVRALLTGSDLTEADLGRADLSGAALGDAVLVKARLLQCNLKKASLERCNCELADLRMANLYGAGLWETKLDRADLREANLAATLLAIR